MSEFPRRRCARVPRFVPDRQRSDTNVWHRALGNVCVGIDVRASPTLGKMRGFSRLRSGRHGVARYIACSLTKMSPNIAMQLSRESLM